MIVTEAPKKDATITIPKVFEQDNETAVSISIPATTAAITIEEDTQEVQSAPKEVTITAPTTSNLTINLPNSTVTLNGESYTTVTATTADNTLIIPEGVKVENLTVNRGNVEIYGDLAVKVAKGPVIRVRLSISSLRWNSCVLSPLKLMVARLSLVCRLSYLMILI